MHCASNDDEIIREGLKTVKKILAENYVRPDEAEKVKSIIRERGSLKIIDKVTVKLNEKRDVYEALLGNLGTKGVEIDTGTVRKYEKLLAGGIWSIITMRYFYEEGQKGSPFIIEDLKPIQMPNMDMDGLFEGRRGFTEDQWIDVLLRSAGYEPTQFERAGQVAHPGPHGPAGREQLQRLRTGTSRHGQEPHLQGNQPQQHPGLRRSHDRRQPVLQHGQPHGRAGRPVGCGGL